MTPLFMSKQKNPEHLRQELQVLGRIMVDYCNENGLVLNGQKTQLLTSARNGIEIDIKYNSQSTWIGV